jgi:hypothetical protein
LADGRLTPIENLKPGDDVASIQIPGLAVDVPRKAQYEWLSPSGLSGVIARVGRVASVKLGEHAGFFVINRRIKVTFEHPFLVRRGDEWGFCSADVLVVGDWLIGQDQREERIESIDRIDAPARTVAIRVPGTNTYLAEGVWVHNDAQNQHTGVANESLVVNEHTGISGASSHHSGSGSHQSGSHASSSHSGSSSGKHSGSSFHSSSHHSGSGHTYSA